MKPLLSPLRRWLVRPPIERLTAAARADVLDHLLSLPDGDRQCRFGAGCSDSGLSHYVERIDFSRDLVLAVRDDGRVLALAHVPVVHQVAELGISVVPAARRRGLALALARSAIKQARRMGAREFRLVFATANEAMRGLALRLGMPLERDGTEWLGRLPMAA